VRGRFFSRFRKDPFLWWSLLTAAVVYALISFVNQYCFRTYTLDLGAYTNALYDYANFSWNDSSAFREAPENLLADHFDLYLPLISPLIYLFGTYTLLIVQLAAVLVGATGVYRYFAFRFPDTQLKRSALLYFLLFFGIFAAFSFDYHSNVVATMLVPWLLLAFHKRQFRRIVLLSFFFLIAKENMALWLVFIGFGLCYLHFKDKQLRYLALGISGASVLYFVLITGIVMPALSNAGVYPHFQYSALGSSFGEALVHLVVHPLDSLRLLFVNHTVFPENDYVKAEFWIVIIVSGFFCLRKPVYLFMLVPVVAQKLFNDQGALWGINQHYAVEFAPLLAIGTFESIAAFRAIRWRRITSVTAVVCSLACAIRVMDHTVAYAEKARIRIYKAAHYSREFPIRKAYNMLERIPDDAIVSAQSAFVSHLALRASVYQFPIIRDAEYILLSPVDNPYPLTVEQFTQKKDSLANSSGWTVVIQNGSFILLKKRHS
jgi:uncharacterized membrane protein